MLRTTNNCKYRSHYDKDNNVVHIYDETEGTNYTSVTNAVDGIVPHLQGIYGFGNNVKVYLYGTDGIISEFFPREKDFNTVDKGNSLVFKEYAEMM